MEAKSHARCANNRTKGTDGTHRTYPWRLLLDFFLRDTRRRSFAEEYSVVLATCRRGSYLVTRRRKATWFSASCRTKWLAEHRYRDREPVGSISSNVMYGVRTRMWMAQAAEMCCVMAMSCFGPGGRESCNLQGKLWLSNNLICPPRILDLSSPSPRNRVGFRSYL